MRKCHLQKGDPETGKGGHPPDLKVYICTGSAEAAAFSTAWGRRRWYSTELKAFIAEAAERSRTQAAETGGGGGAQAPEAPSLGVGVAGVLTRGAS